MEDLSLHILDIVENSTAAGASLVEMIITEDIDKDILTIIIKDNGKGMDEEMVKKVRDPFTTTRTTRRVGLGIPFLDQSAREADGKLEIDSIPGKKTEVKVTFKHSHIDRKPVGDMGSTIITLLIGNPEIDFYYKSNIDGKEIELDTRELKAELGDISITDQAVLNLIKELFQKDSEE